MKTIVCFIAMFFASFVFAQTEEEKSPVNASIEVEQQDNILTFHSKIQNNGDLFLEYNYLLLVKKTDHKKNLSINRQSGKFTLEPNEAKQLSQTQINISNEQSLIAYLYIRDENENKLITKDSIAFENLSALKTVDEKSLIIEGLVIDETKTKLGAEFYDQFYSMYHQLPKKYRFMISISELPYRGQSSIIQVNIGQDLIQEFFSNPNEEFNKEQATLALRRIAAYAANKEKIKLEFIY